MNAIVTGATKGMGLSISKHLAANNYNLALCARNGTELQNLQKELRAQYPQLDIVVLPTDCAKPEDVRSFAEFVSSNFEFVDVLINNAGLFIPSKLMTEGDDDLAMQMQVNVSTPHFLCKHFGSRMQQAGRGHIINICSISSVKPTVTAGSYSISKVALLGLTKILREELMASGVKVTAVLPGSTLTGSWEGTSIPASRFIDSDDIARSVIACLSMSAGANVDEIIIRPLKGDL
ncbi:SDR family oxidoreductase [Flavihumibacter sp. R14]|nr:SDR family oxidoreductase [Flavihumibacter soli]